MEAKTSRRRGNFLRAKTKMFTVGERKFLFGRDENARLDFPLVALIYSLQAVIKIPLFSKEVTEHIRKLMKCTLML
jgi:hypothetical protein